MSDAPSTLRRLLLAGVALALAGGVEIGARVLEGDRARSVFVLEDHLPPDQADAVTASEVVPGWDLPARGGKTGTAEFEVDRWGMRGATKTVDPAKGTHRLILVGDSILFGSGLSDDQTIATDLASLREKAEKGTTWQVAACAAPGHSSWQGRVKLKEQCLSFKPEYVVIGSLMSDYTRDVGSDRQLMGGGEGSFLSKHLATWRWLFGPKPFQAEASKSSAGQASTTSGPKGRYTRVPPDEYEENLRAMVSDSRRANARPLLLVPPFAQDLWGYVEGQELGLYRLIMRTVATEENVPLVDCPPEFAKQERGAPLFQDMVLPNGHGAGLIAGLIDEALGELRNAPSAKATALNKKGKK